MHFSPFYDFPTRNSLLKIQLNGMPVADGSFGMAMAFIIFGGLTNVSRLVDDRLALNRLALSRNGCGLHVYAKLVQVLQ